MKIYGTVLCGDCRDCKNDLDEAGIDYNFLDITQELQNLKEFLKIRDTNPLFQEVKENGGIGIPCIIKDDGEVTLDWKELLN